MSHACSLFTCCVQVLRYFGYFQEAVNDSREENWRVRKVVIFLYLEDDSMQVTEPPEPNSGLPQVGEVYALLLHGPA